MADMAPKRAGGEKRGNAADRRRRKYNLLAHHGDGTTAPCAWCGDALTFDTVEADRVVCGDVGGRYVMVNLIPACRFCNASRGAATVAEYLPTAKDADRAVAAIAHAATYSPRR